MHLEAKQRREADLAEVTGLLKRGLALQAYAFSQEKGLGDLQAWDGADEMILAGRLLTPLGASRKSDVLHYKVFRRYPEHARAALYYAFGIAARFGVLRALPHVRWALESLDASPEVRADLLAFRGFLCGSMRDFSVANADVDAALEMLPERAWLWAERSSVYRMEDRYDEALEAAQHALKLRPFYRVAVEQVADLYYLANRDTEAVELLEEAARESEMSYTVGRLSAYYSELGEIDKTLEALDRYEALTPLAEKQTVKWLARRRSDLLYLKGDLPKVIELAPATDSKYHKRIAKRLESDEHAGGKRVKLPVGFVRQHEMTCAPATLTAVANFWGREADHLEVAEEICYDGTPGHSERHWAASNGYFVREFKVDWEVTVALIDRGIPFTVGTVETTSAHLQAVIGYDAQIGLLLVRDPTHKHFQEFSADKFFEKYAASGPRGMVFVPEAEAAKLDGIDFPEASLYDRAHEINRALERHDRKVAVEQLEALAEEAPGHRMTISSERALAHYDGDEPRTAETLDKLIALYPKNKNFQMAKFNNRRGFWSWEQKCAFVRERLAEKHPEAVYFRELGELLADDGRYYADALYYFRRGFQRQPRDADQLHGMAGVLWNLGERVEATELYRFAACLEPTWEYLAESYFRATRFLRKGEEGLAFLRERFEKLGAKSSLPVRTLYDGFGALHRTGEGLEILEVALERRPTDGSLMLFMSRKFAAYNRGERAGELLEAAKGKCAESAWLREGAQQAWMRGDLAEAEQLWERVLESRPLDIGAQRSYVRIVAEARGPEAGLEYLRDVCGRFPSSVPLHELYVEWLNEKGPVAAEPAVRHLLEQAPTNNWARRELVLNLDKQGRTEDALAEAERMVEAAPNESYSHSIRSLVLRSAGDAAGAAVGYRRALELSADNENAISGLVEVAKSDAERRQALAFIEGEFEKQVLFGGALLSYRDEAFPILEPGELLASLRKIHEERPDIWQSWSAVINQLKSMGDYDAALELATKMIERFPLLPRVYLELAEVQEARGDVDGEIEALRSALDVNPHWTYAMRQLGMAYQTKREYPEARKQFEAAIAEDPLESAGYGFLAELMWKTDAREEAVEKLKKAVVVDPGYLWGWDTLSGYLRELDRSDEAVVLARELSEQRPHESRPWDVLSGMLGNYGRYEEQLEALDEGLARHPREIDFHDRKVMALVELSRFDEAQAACRAEVFGEEIPRTLLGREAWVLWMRGEKEEAIAKMEVIAEAEPDYYWAIKQLCDWLVDEEKYEKAVIWAPRLARLAPDDAGAHGTVGYAMAAADRKEDACESLYRAFQLDPEYSYAGNNLFDWQLELGRIDAAEETLERLLLHLPDRFSRGREVLFELKKGNRERALELHAEICRDPEVSASTLGWLDETLDDGREAGEMTWVYEKLVLAGGVARGVADRWIRRAVSGGAVQVPKRFAGLSRDSELRRQAWVTYFEVMGERTASDSTKARKFIRKNRAELAGATETWEQVGYYLNCEGRYEEAAKWLADWRGREGLSQWALCQRTRSLEARVRTFGKADEVRRWSFENLPEDHTTKNQKAMLAFTLACEPGGEAFDALVLEIEPSELDPFYRYCFEMASTVRHLREGGAGRKVAELAYGRALETLPGWKDFKTEAVVQRLTFFRSFVRALPSTLALRLLWDAISCWSSGRKR